MKKIFLFVLVAALFISVVSCGAPAETREVTKVVYLINGSLGDNAFYDSGQAGMEKIAQDYGVEIRTIECNYDAGLYEPSLRAAVDYADVIFVISYAFEDQLMEYADKNPNKIFVNLDTVVQNEGKTITSVDFIEEEGAFLVGMAAALATSDTSIPNINEEKIIGAVGGDVDPVISSFVFAYENGAKYVDPEVKVETKFLGGEWVDSAKGKQAALQLYDMGADIVFQIAAAAGLGVLQAAAERDLYAIGVDTNQNDLEPGHVIVSDVKNVGYAIESVFKTIKDGTYQAGQLLEYGLAMGGVDADFTATEQILPQYIIDEVNAVRKQIIDGKYIVERYTVD